MPKCPEGVRRPADTTAAVMVGHIATGEIEDKLSKAPRRDRGAIPGRDLWQAR